MKIGVKFEKKYQVRQYETETVGFWLEDEIHIKDDQDRSENPTEQKMTVFELMEKYQEIIQELADKIVKERRELNKQEEKTSFLR